MSTSSLTNTEKLYSRVGGEEYTIFYHVNSKSNNTEKLYSKVSGEEYTTFFIMSTSSPAAQRSYTARSMRKNIPCFIMSASSLTTQRSYTARSMGMNIPFFTMSTSSLTTQLTFLNAVSNTSIKQYSRLINVRMVIWVISNASPYLPRSCHNLLSSSQNTGVVQLLQNNWIQA